MGVFPPHGLSWFPTQTDGSNTWNSELRSAQGNRLDLAQTMTDFSRDVISQLHCSEYSQLNRDMQIAFGNSIDC